MGSNSGSLADTPVCGYNVRMNVATIGIRELRDGLSKHLGAVQEGTEIIVTDHGTPVARIVPFGRESGLEKLVREGVVSLPTGPRRPLPELIETRGPVTDLLSDSRGRF